MTPEWKESHRPGFEAWMRTVGYCVSWHFGRRQDCPGSYCSDVVNHRWIAWIAAKADQVEVTDEMVERGTRANWSIVLSKLATEEDRDRHWQEIKSMNPDKVAYIRAEVQSVLISALNPPPAGDGKRAKE